MAKAKVKEEIQAKLPIATLKAYSVLDFETLRYEYTMEELDTMKHELYLADYEIFKRESAIKSTKSRIEGGTDESIKALLQEVLKTDFGHEGKKILEITANDLIHRISKGYEMREIEAYSYAYYEIRQMAFYSPEGLLLFFRDMEGEENQQRIQPALEIVE